MSASTYFTRENGKIQLTEAIECSKEELQNIIGQNEAIIETKVIMWDGSIKNIKDIKIGDYVMGNDSTPRRVTKTSTSKKKSYIVTPSKGQKFLCNSDTKFSVKGILPRISIIKKNNNKYGVVFSKQCSETIRSFATMNEAENFILTLKEDIYDMPFSEYEELSSNKQSQCYLYHIGLNFQEKILPMDPYLIGYWLGHGTSRDPVVTILFDEIATEFTTILQNYNLTIKQRGKKLYGILYDGKRGIGKNVFKNTLKTCNLINNKHIPDIYKYNSYENRMRLLAGIIDSNGNAYGTYIDICQINIDLANDISYLAYSLGFMVSKKEVIKSSEYKGVTKYGISQKITIFGNNIENIPCILERKKCKKGLANKRSSCNKFSIQESKSKTFYEIEVDGDGHYLTDDFMVACCSEL